MKLKTDEKGNVVVQDGKPVYVHDDGREVPFDASATVATITRLNREAQGHRERAESAETKLKAFEGIEDAEAARKAIELASNIDAGKLVAAGKVEEIKAAAKKAAEEQVAAMTKAHANELQVLKADNAKLTGTLHSELIGGSFTRSKFIGEKVAIPADLVQARFGNNFKIEDGKVVAYDNAGNKVFSRVRHGELADFDEALETLVTAYPNKDQILKGTVGNGGGAKPNGGGGSGGPKSISRAQFDALDSAARFAHTRGGGTIAD